MQSLFLLLKLIYGALLGLMCIGPYVVLITENFCLWPVAIGKV